MAYADRQMSSNRVIAIIIVALIHVALGYALITGLAYSAIKQAVERVTTVDIEEPEEPEEEPEPPPPDEVMPPPPVAPPPPINISIAPPPIQTVTTPPPPAPIARIVPPSAPPAPPPPPAAPPKAATPRGNYNSWASTEDYPSRALRDEREGTTSIRVSVTADGRVGNCSVTRSSGHPDLDSTTCQLITRRGRFNPAEQNGRAVEGSWTTSIRWQIPDE